MTTKTFYCSIDDKCFETKEECIAYETKLNKDINAFFDKYKCYDSKGYVKERVKADEIMKLISGTYYLQVMNDNDVNTWGCYIPLPIKKGFYKKNVYDGTWENLEKELEILKRVVGE